MISSSGTSDLSAQRLERGFLIVGGVFLLVNAAGLDAARGTFTPSTWGILAAWLIGAWLGLLWLDRRLPRRDPVLYPLALFMAGWGLITIERLTPLFASRQVIWLLVGIAALCTVVAFPGVLRLLRTYRYTLLAGGLLLLIVTIVLGVNPSGQAGAPELWLGTGTVFFQPSELLKIILVAFLASYLAEQYPTLRASGLEPDRGRLRLSPRLFGPVLLMWAVSIVMLIWQRDLGAAVLFFTVFLLLTYIASGYTLLLVAGGGLVIAAGFAAYQLIDLVQLRIDIWITPWPEADGRAYQIVQSLMAFGAGGIFGQGIGTGSPGYIPVVHSDFIFAALAEEWGLLGVIVVIACLAMLTLRGIRISLQYSGQAFHALFAVGLSILVGVQSLLIMGGVIKLIPLTGVTLPFFSYGGSSLLINFILVGLLLRLSADALDAPR